MRYWVEIMSSRIAANDRNIAEPGGNSAAIANSLISCSSYFFDGLLNPKIGSPVANQHPTSGCQKHVLNEPY